MTWRRYLVYTCATERITLRDAADLRSRNSELLYRSGPQGDEAGQRVYETQREMEVVPRGSYVIRMQVFLPGGQEYLHNDEQHVLIRTSESGSMRTTLDLFCHMHWADATVWGAVHGARQHIDDERLRKLLYHIHMVQRAFLRIWSDPDMKLPKIDEFPSLGAIGAWAQAYHAMLPLYLETVSEEDMDGVVNVPWARFMVQRFGKNPKDVTLGETMLQVAMHSIYHRGQVNTRLRELGIDPPLVDYIAWTWLGRPEAEWPDLTNGAST